MSPCDWNILLTIAVFSYLSYISSQPLDFPTVNISSYWINSPSLSPVGFPDSSIVGPILVRDHLLSPHKYVCGFYCNNGRDLCETYLFAIFMVSMQRGSTYFSTVGVPGIVWSANRNNPVKTNATLQLTHDGDLVLRDDDGILVWSTNTAGVSVAGLNLTEMGNLVLFDTKGTIVWQSFDHPTDALVLGQPLVSGKSLTASASPANWTEGLFSISMTNTGLEASILSDPPQVYHRTWSASTNGKRVSYVMFRNGSLELYNETNYVDVLSYIPRARGAQYMELGPDGHLRVFEWTPLEWVEVADIFSGYIGECGDPMVCGKYGICSSNGQCSCPRSISNIAANFVQINDRQPKLGCSEVVPLTCNASSNHSFLDLENVTYFDFAADVRDVDIKSCKEACLRNCSCNAVVFKYGSNSSNGVCYMPSQIFSLANDDDDRYNSWSVRAANSSISIKVEIAPTTVEIRPTVVEGKKSSLGLILALTVGISSAVVIICTSVFVYRRKRNSEQTEEDYLDHVPGMPTRFSFEELVTATNNFDKKLGEGGFGLVFEGSLKDGTRIAVKRLDGVGHVKKSFLAEVETIGSIHHVNLVRLIGFCAEKSHRLLVYEYMCNGSLDKWIYQTCPETSMSLGWNCRRRIILDIAKGLAYLHEDCRQKIVHLDIKPHNILLDENHNAKLADFGLSKLIDRNQSQVVTTMRGTPGYLAPEWLSAVITEKVDVYSFGIVVLEILCGRKNFEQSKPDEEQHLLNLFKQKAEEGRWLDLADKCCRDTQSNEAQVVEMMQIAAWCLRGDHSNRPSMSLVIKVLEGTVKDVLKNIDYDFSVPHGTIRLCLVLRF